MVAVAVGPECHHGQQPPEHDTFNLPIKARGQPLDRLQQEQPAEVYWDAVQIVEGTKEYPHHGTQPHVQSVGRETTKRETLH